MKKKGSIRIIKNVFFMLRYVFKYTPLYGISHILLQMAFGVLDIMWGILVMKLVVDAVFAKDFITVLIVALIYLVYASTIQVMAAYMYEVYVPVQKEKLNREMNKDLYEKAAKLDYSCYSNPTFYNDFVWAASQCDGKASEALDLVAAFMKNLTTLAGIITVIAALEKIGLIFAAISTAAMFIFKMIQNKLGLKKAEESKPYERKRDYINRVFYLIDYAKEIRISKLKTNLTDEYIEANKGIKNIIKKYYKKFIALNFVSYYLFVNVLMDGIFLYIIAYRTVALGVLSAGSFAALSDGSWTLKWSFENFINTMSGVQEKSLYIEKFRYFLKYDNKITEQENPLSITEHIGAMSVKNVSFTYDGVDAPTLKNISMEINPREKVAIVGYNGAGKSTLIKLLTRLYDVSEGEITYDGKDIKEYKLEEYYKNFGTVFQDHELFAGTLHENVIMDTDDEGNRKSESEEALDKSGFSDKLASLKNALDSNMTREFHEDGISLSGGETQKVAIARIFASKTAKVLILDEPSSALDPMSEYNLNCSMLEAAKEKTVVFISHRLSTTKIADRIYMMEKGEIIESGSHDELMKMNGKYSEMFRLQTENYAFN